MAKKTITVNEQKQREKEKIVQAMTERVLEQEKQKDIAISAYESWKLKKDVHIKDVGKLYTYHPNPREPPKVNKWCPARSMKYDYPSEKRLVKSLKKSNTRREIEPSKSALLNETYNLDSFDSDGKSSIVEDNDDDESVSDT